MNDKKQKTTDFYYTIPENSRKIAEIKRLIVLSMNGVVADRMKESGLNYAKNYGVSVTRLKEIAASYAPDANLAEGLWRAGIRETMILSTWIEPIATFDTEKAKSRIGNFNNIEIVEQFCLNLLSKLNLAPQLSIECAGASALWTKVTGFLLAARVYRSVNSDQVQELIELAFRNAETPEYHLYKTIALCLGRLCRLGDDVVDVINRKITVLEAGVRPSEKYIAEEVKQEIKFLKEL